MNLSKLLGAFAIGALVAASPMKPALAQDLKPVSIATSTTGMLYLPIYVADTMGYFKDEGLEVNTQTMKSNAIMAAVIGGDVDIYPGTASGALTAAAKGTGVKIFGGLLTQYASNVVLQGDVAKKLGLTKDSTIEEREKALKGLTIAVTGAGSGTHQLALYLLEQAGLNPDRDATIMFIGGSREILAAFQHKRIDGFILSNPTSDTAVMDYDGYQLFNMVGGDVKELNGYPYIVLITRNEWLKDDPERAEAFLRAIGKAQAAIRDPKIGDEVRDKVYEAHLKQFDKKLFDAAWANMKDAYPTSPKLTKDKIMQAVDYLNKFSDDKYEPSVVDQVLPDDHTEANAAK